MTKPEKFKPNSVFSAIFVVQFMVPSIMTNILIRSINRNYIVKRKKNSPIMYKSSTTENNRFSITVILYSIPYFLQKNTMKSFCHCLHKVTYKTDKTWSLILNNIKR